MDAPLSIKKRYAPRKRRFARESTGRVDRIVCSGKGDLRRAIRCATGFGGESGFFGNPAVQNILHWAGVEL